MARDGTVRSGTKGNKGGGQSNPKPPDLSVIPIKHVNISQYEKPDPFLNEKQAGAVTLKGRDVYYKLMVWLDQAGCKNIQPKLVEEYALSYARWRQAEKLISKHGLLAPHPTTGVPMTSPLVSVSQGYYKQMHAAWYAIWDVLKTTAKPAAEQDDMEMLLAEIG